VRHDCSTCPYSLRQLLNPSTCASLTPSQFASIGIHLRHRITSHGFAMNITPEPIKWFDLVLACGLADVRATSLHDLLETASAGSGLLPPTLPSVQGVAEGLVPRFRKAYGREVIPLNESGGGADVEELREVIGLAEREAERVVKQMGGWRSEPDLSKRVL
jgi:hypothetical protein